MPIETDAALASTMVGVAFVIAEVVAHRLKNVYRVCIFLILPKKFFLFIQFWRMCVYFDPMDIKNIVLHYYLQ